MLCQSQCGSGGPAPYTSDADATNVWGPSQNPDYVPAGGVVSECVMADSDMQPFTVSYGDQGVTQAPVIDGTNNYFQGQVWDAPSDQGFAGDSVYGQPGYGDLQGHPGYGDLQQPVYADQGFADQQASLFQDRGVEQPPLVRNCRLVPVSYTPEEGYKYKEVCTEVHEKGMSEEFAQMRLQRQAYDDDESDATNTHEVSDKSVRSERRGRKKRKSSSKKKRKHKKSSGSKRSRSKDRKSKRHSTRSGGSGVEHVSSSKELEALLQINPKVFVFFSMNQKLCWKVKPAYVKLAKKYKKRAVFAIVRIDLVQHVGETYRVDHVPCFKVFEDGRVVKSHIGEDETKLKNFVRKYL